MTALRIVFVAVAVELMCALISACEPFRAQVVINETPAPIPTPAPVQPAPIIIVQPAPVQAPPAADYTLLILMMGMTSLVIVVAIAIVLTRRQSSQTTTAATSYAPVAPYMPELPPAPPAPPTRVINHYHLYIGIMSGETRGDALARLVRAGVRFEDASAALNAPNSPHTHAELPAPRGK